MTSDRHKPLNPTGAKQASGEGDAPDLARGTGLGIIGTGVSQGSLFLTVVLVAAVLGTSGVGVYSQAFAILMLGSFLALVGMQTTLTRFVAQHRVSGEVQSIRVLVRWGVAGPTLVGFVLGAVAFLCAPWVARDLLNEPDLVAPLQIVGLALPAATYAKACASVLQGYGNIRDLVVITLVLEPGLRLVLTAVALAAGTGINGAAVALVCSNVASAVWARHRLWAVVPRKTPRTDYPWPPVLRFAGLTWTASVANMGLLWIDVLLIGAFRSSSDVGVYQVATRVVTVATLASVPIATAFAPRIAEFVRREEWDRLRAAYTLTTTWSTRLAVPMIVLCVTMPRDVLGLFGTPFAVASAVTVILAGGKLVEAATGPCGMVLNMSSRVGLNAANNVAALVLNIALNIVLIPRAGLVGAAVAWSASLALLNVARVLQVRWVLGIQPDQGRVAWAVLAAAPGILLAYAIGRLLPTPASVVVAGVIVVLVYAVTVRLTDWHASDTAVTWSVLPRFGTPRRRTANGADSDGQDARGAHRPGPSSHIDVWSLVSPLRYDVTVRAAFFRFIEENLSLYESSPERFMELARAQDYYTWYSRIAFPQEYGYRRRKGIEACYRRRVQASVTLYRKFQQNGFDVRHPITVWQVENPLPTGSGKRVNRRHFLFDGCHRLALLINSGVKHLGPEMVRLHPVDALSPRDNTAQLLPLLKPSIPRYLSFVRRGYGADVANGETVTQGDDGTTRDMDPELRAVIAADYALLGGEVCLSSEDLDAHTVRPHPGENDRQPLTRSVES